MADTAFQREIEQLVREWELEEKVKEAKPFKAPAENYNYLRAAGIGIALGSFAGCGMYLAIKLYQVVESSSLLHR